MIIPFSVRAVQGFIKKIPFHGSKKHRLLSKNGLSDKERINADL